jgi:hypothetical protein
MNIKNHLDTGWGFGVVFSTCAILEIRSKFYCQSSWFQFYGRIILMIYALDNVPFVGPNFFYHQWSHLIAILQSNKVLFS